MLNMKKSIKKPFNEDDFVEDLGKLFNRYGVDCHELEFTLADQVREALELNHGSRKTYRDRIREKFKKVDQPQNELSATPDQLRRLFYWTVIDDVDSGCFSILKLRMLENWLEYLVCEYDFTYEGDDYSGVSISTEKFFDLTEKLNKYFERELEKMVGYKK